MSEATYTELAPWWPVLAPRGSLLMRAHTPRAG